MPHSTMHHNTPPSWEPGSPRQRLQGLRERFPLRGLLLYVLPLPLLPALLVSLVRGQVGLTLANLAALFLLILGGALVRRGLARERRVPLPQGPPFKLLGSLSVAAGCGLCVSQVVGQPPVIALFLALMAALGSLLAYGTDRRARRIPRPRTVARDADTKQLLDEAVERLETIRAAGARLRAPRVRAMVEGFVDTGRGIVEAMAADPDTARRSRKFVKVYLRELAEITTRFAEGQDHPQARVLEERLTGVLQVMEEVLQERQAALGSRDFVDLDVRMEVLAQRLRREGL